MSTRGGIALPGQLKMENKPDLILRGAAYSLGQWSVVSLLVNHSLAKLLSPSLHTLIIWVLQRRSSHVIYLILIGSSRPTEKYSIVKLDKSKWVGEPDFARNRMMITGQGSPWWRS